MVQLTEQSLLGLGSLKKLDMSYNQFNAFPENVFQWLGSLLELDLGFNYLFDDMAMAMMLDSFPQLERLSLAGTKVNPIPAILYFPPQINKSFGS